MRAIQLRIENGRLTEDALNVLQEPVKSFMSSDEQGKLSEQDLRDLDRALDAGLVKVRSRTRSI